MLVEGKVHCHIAAYDIENYVLGKNIFILPKVINTVFLPK